MPAIGMMTDSDKFRTMEKTPGEKAEGVLPT